MLPALNLRLRILAVKIQHRKGNKFMNNKKLSGDFLFDINNPRLNVLLEESLKNNLVSVVGATGNVGDTDLFSKINLNKKDIETIFEYLKENNNK